MIALIRRISRVSRNSIKSKENFTYYKKKAIKKFTKLYTRKKRSLFYRLDVFKIKYENYLQSHKEKYDLVILDDIFPQQISAFRIAEFNYYLENFKKSIVYSTGNAFQWVGEYRIFEEVVNDYESKYSHLKNRVYKFDSRKILHTKLLYLVFIENAFNFIKVIEREKIPFIFTLYPGGGFQLNDQISDHKLRSVFASPYFKKVIVTQKVTYNYLIEHNFCDKSAIEFIYGVVMPLETYKFEVSIKKYFPDEKQTFDLCFVANKQMPKGEDKGYDKFIEVAHILTKKYKNIFFHIVGPFDKNTIDIWDIENNIKFYGYLNTNQFPKFYSTKDIILSPNIHFVLSPGGFDGFPTGASTEAGLNGVALFVTDTLNQNIIFEDKKHIVIVPYDSQKIAKIVEEYYLHPEELYELALEGKKRIDEVYSINAQMLPRKELILTYLKN